MTGCGETSEARAAGVHALVALLYAIMIGWHVWSVALHWQRREEDA